METMGLGAGSYPEPPEPKEKCYMLTCECSQTVEFTIWAKDYSEAEIRVMCGDYDVKNEISDLKIEEILNYEVDE